MLKYIIKNDVLKNISEINLFSFFVKVKLIILNFLKIFILFLNLKIFYFIGKTITKAKNIWIFRWGLKIKYFWISGFTVNNFNMSMFYFSKNIKFLDSYEYKYSFLYFKNEIAFLKKKNQYQKNILVEYGNFRKNVFNTLEKTTIFNKNFTNTNLNDVNNYWIEEETNDYIQNEIPDTLKNKNIEGFRKFKLIINENRNLLRNLYFIKSPRQYMFNRKFMFFFKKEAINFIRKLEFTVSNIILRSNFFSNKNFFFFFLVNKNIFINGILLDKQHETIKVFDRIEFRLDKYYFFFYKQVFENVFFLDKKATDKIWKIHRYVFNLTKTEPTKFPIWVTKLIYLNADNPKFLEIDYTRLLIIFLFEPYFVSDFSWHILRFVNYFLLRLYNWKYII